MAISRILVIGGGMCGLASAIAIAQAFPPSSQPDVRITVFELRDVPSTIGGAVNLTPTALRCLDILGVLEELKKRKAGSEVRAIQIFSLHTGSSLGNIDYSGPEGNGFGGYRGWRIARSDLLQALLAVIQKLENVEIVYSKKVVELQESSSAVDVTFEDGTHATGDLVLGCDGIHSSTRMKLVELDRKPTYSGIAAAYGYANVADVFDSGEKRPFFRDTGLTMSRSGALLTTFADDSRHRIYLAALMETKEQDSLEGWRAAGRDQEAVRNEVTRRTRDAELPHIKEMVQSVREWTLYPVYLLPPPGKWHTGRVILLGDAAHAMPPKGESIGYALEDAIIFSRVLKHFGLSATLETVFSFYETVRRKTIEDAYRRAAMGWHTRKDSSYLVTKIVEWLTPWYLWWTRKSMEQGFLTDPRDIQFPKD
ncbi:hypothetical protein Egran_04575 [Elaphomyces granulatus]|uniref:FAD-binding domain-containing protein n=1 Tax=Elaphomyces granulatus TaxID=519963 RepID=A0A232LUZ7_9EURO|nr:hypothetical protein Egran_04575 [Elaphomyces granulatus]